MAINRFAFLSEIKLLESYHRHAYLIKVVDT